MGWETRKRGAGSYYYRGRRVEGGIKKEYRGGGIIGQLAALRDEYECQQREEKAAYSKEERGRLEREVAFLGELEEAAEVLTRAVLVVGGYRRHKGEWRMARD